MRFLQSVVATMALIGMVDAKLYQFDVTGDNTFQVYVSKAGTATSVILKGDSNQPSVDGRNQEKQFGWNTPARYSNVNLDVGDVISVYVQNELAAANPTGTIQAQGNPSAIVGRLREITAPNQFVNGGDDIPTDEKWDCAYRIETRDEHRVFDPARLTGNPDDWAAANLPIGATWNNLATQHQLGSISFTPAVEVSPLTANNIWANTGIGGPFGTTAIVNGIPVTPNLGLSTPYWIFGTNQQTTNALVHHGWCRYTIPPSGGAPTSPPGGNGDPVFSGFQGQEFQFHGLPDEHFNLISSPSVQLNAHFVYLSSGKCDYTDTACWTHPGTYMDQMGFSIGEARVKVIAGSHADGLRVWVNDAEVPRHTVIGSLSNNVTATLRYSKNGHVHIHTDLIDYTVINSDMFLNLQASIKSGELLRLGATKHTVTDSSICHTNAETHNHQLIESTVSKKYPITTRLHGLVGQTWRNVKVCGRDWMGTVTDYVTESLFGTTYHYNYFQF